MGMRARDSLAQSVPHTAQDGINMRGLRGSRIDDHQVGFADHIGIGAGAGHGPGVRIHDPPHALRHLHFAVGLHLIRPAAGWRLQSSRRRRSQRQRLNAKTKELQESPADSLRSRRGFGELSVSICSRIPATSACTAGSSSR